ncbi:CvpA family protein [Aureisphaera galaxeae]|uniref:CvpA family protein n=1 Tax=Aureisphaera galaxeae TaxID=1538023 RepID=UPI00234FE734|nr:CvpA family protein [Aureisphaera galaxeae]MDC8005299.1 CvpA family protein [Aureisphaera galaxeae]
MNIIDIVLGVILLLAFISGFRKGLFVALASLIGLIAGVFGAIYFSDFAGAYISRWFNWSDEVTKLASFAVTFLIIVILINMAGKFLTKIADFAALGLLNKLLGGVFALLQYAFIVSVVFMFFNNSNLTGYVISEEKKENSVLYTPVAALAPLVIPKVLAHFKSETDETEPTESSASI